MLGFGLIMAQRIGFRQVLFPYIMYIYEMKVRRLPKYTVRDAQFTTKVDAWQPMPGGFLTAFGREGLDSLNVRERGFEPDSRKVAFLTFENSFAPLGGLAAVVRILPDCLKRAGEDVTVLTPLYANIPKVKEPSPNKSSKPPLTAARSAVTATSARRCRPTS